LDFDSRAVSGGYGVAFNKWRIKPGRFPVSIVLSLKTYFARHQADADHSHLQVILFGLRSVVIRGARARSVSEAD
jgi:hypothetical protein